jgi:asparagine synthase (glutamine-hydrolysing)
MPAAFQDKLTAFASKILPESLEFNKFSTKLKRFILMAAKPYDERHYNWISVFRDMEKSNLFTEEFRKEVNDKPSFYYLDNVFKECGAKNVLDRVMCADIQTYLLEDLLVKMDVATMANSLEGRSPFLDHKVMEFAATIPGRMKIKGMKLKYIIKKALRGKLPDEILSRGKMGFGIPIDKWFRGELKDYSQDILMSDKCIGRNYFKKENIARLLSDHYDSKANNGARIWSLLNLELWHRVFLDKDIKI